ncbi:beta-phosphoglucomutase [bacterium]|nr:beta-phosphoglucomutase [bacterium]
MKALIFDLDGVLVDTARFHYIAWNDLAHDFGFEISEAENEQLKGVSRVDSLEQILLWGNISLSSEQKEQALIKKNEHYLSLCQQLTPSDCLPGVQQFLAEVAESGLRCAVGSASKNAALILKKLQLANFFDALVDGTMTTKGKPDPEVFTKAAERMHVQAWQTIVFEDAEKGIQAATKGGFNTVGIGSPHILKQAALVIDGFEKVSLGEVLNHFNQ